MSLVAAESAPAVQREKEKEEGRGGSVLADKRTQTSLLLLLPYALLTSAIFLCCLASVTHTPKHIL